MGSLSGKTALITGATGGLGREYAKRLMEEGADVVLSDLTTEELEKRKEKLDSRLADAPGNVRGHVAADVSTEDGCRLLYEKSSELAPGLDILINNAGVITYGHFHEVPPPRWEALMQVNLLAPMRLSHLFLKDMICRGAGHIVFTCSVAGFVATALGAPYSTSKFGLRGFAMAMAREVKPMGVNVTVVYPFWVKTKLLDSPSYGGAEVGKLPDFFVENPSRVVKAAVKGIKKKRLHVYPGPYAKLVWQAAKLCPFTSRQAH